MRSFSEKLKSARAMRELTQQQLADKVGVTLRSIQAYELGAKSPRQATIQKLAKELGVSIRFLTDKECNDPMKDIEKDIYIEKARTQYGNEGARDINLLLRENAALFAGGDLSQEQKDAFFDAIMKAYITCKEDAKKTFGRKKEEKN